MAIHTLGTLATNSLRAVTFNPPQGVGQSAASSLLSPADLAQISQTIAADRNFAASNPIGILCTGSTHSNTTLDTLVSTAGGPLASIHSGDVIIGLGGGIPPGTFVVTKPSSPFTSLTMSQAATASLTGVRIGIIYRGRINNEFNFNGQLEIPGGRGYLTVKNGDVVAIDNTGWPILISAAAIAYPGTSWSLV